MGKNQRLSPGEEWKCGGGIRARYPLAGGAFLMGKQSGGLYTLKTPPLARVRSSSRETMRRFPLVANATFLTPLHLLNRWPQCGGLEGPSSNSAYPFVANVYPFGQEQPGGCYKAGQDSAYICLAMRQQLCILANARGQAPGAELWGS